MNPAFTVKLEQQIYSGLAVVGKFDGNQPSLAAATTGGKILVHSPHESAGAQGGLNKLRYLNLNRKISSLAAGSLSKGESAENEKADFIFVGTQSNLLGYDVERNADAFFVDVADGVNALVVGSMANQKQPLVIAGGNCSILGFDERGAEAFWTVTGDNVSSMALCDVNGTGRPLLLVGSEDFEIRIFQNEELVTEITEADKVSILESIKSGPKFAYGLANGTVGVYTNPKNRLWRVKTKNNVTAVHSYDLDLDGVPEIFSGWSSGAYNVRREDNGEVVFRSTMDAPVSAILSTDYRMSGKEEVMICSEAGEIRGYVASEMELGALHESGVAKNNTTDQKVLNELQMQKLELLAELKLMERAAKVSTTKADELPVGMLPMNTELSYQFDGDLTLGALILRVQVNTDVQIVNLIAEDLEGVLLVDREVVAIAPRAQSKTAELPLRPTKYNNCELRIQTHVATRALGAQLHVFETNIKVPKFAAFKYLPDPSYYKIPAARVQLQLRENLDRMMAWVQTAFLIPRIHSPSENQMSVFFVSVCPIAGYQSNYGDAASGNTCLMINMQNVSESGNSFLRVQLQCENMDLVAELVQDMAQFFKIEELESECDFPEELTAFEEVVRRVADCNAARVSLTADMADDSQRIKALVIRAEDARLMGDMETMRKSYTELSVLNNQLITGYNIRAQNQANLLASLKEVNQMIQKAANLRVGKAKTRVITDCRTAVKLNNMKALFKIIKRGFDPNSLKAQAK